MCFKLYKKLSEASKSVNKCPSQADIVGLTPFGFYLINTLERLLNCAYPWVVAYNTVVP